jgi:hypothetical protein
VREPGRNPQHVAVLGGQGHSDPSPESRGASPDINRNVIDRSGYYTDEFPLRFLNLVMQSPQSMPSRATMIVLDEPGIDAAGRKLAFLPRLEKKTACIAEHLRTNQHDIGDRGGLELHFTPARALSREGKIHSRSSRAAALIAPDERRRYIRPGRRSPPGNTLSGLAGSRSPR